MKPDPDRALVSQAQKGNQQAFELLYHKYHAKVGRLLSTVLINRSELEDASQVVFIKAYRALPDFRGDSRFYTWLHRIALNTALSFNQRNQRRAEDRLDEDSKANRDDQPWLQTVLTPEAALQQQELSEVIQSAVLALPPHQRQTLILREIEGCSYQEIAQAMNCSLGTVRSRLHRARETIAGRLRSLLKD